MRSLSSIHKGVLRMEFLEINGVEVPCPSVGLEIVISTAVNAGRNAQTKSSPRN